MLILHCIMIIQNPIGSSWKGTGLKGAYTSKIIIVFTICIMLKEEICYPITHIGVALQVYVLSHCLFWWSHSRLYNSGTINWSKNAVYKHVLYIIE